MKFCRGLFICIVVVVVVVVFFFWGGGGGNYRMMMKSSLVLSIMIPVIPLFFMYPNMESFLQGADRYKHTQLFHSPEICGKNYKNSSV